MGLVMIGKVDPVILDQEARRMVTALTLLRPFTRRRGRSESRPERADASGCYETDLADASVSEFRRRCSWE